MAKGEQPTILEVMRRTELKRRAYRRAVMLNEAALADEPAAPEDKEIARKLQAQTLFYEKMQRPGYWQRLWAALRGK